jgi:uncharacterized protein
MILSMYRASIPVFLRGLDVLSVLLDRADVDASARGFDAGILAGARLAPDMLPFTGQIQRASDTAKFAAGRLTDFPSPRFADTELTLDELRQRIGQPQTISRPSERSSSTAATRERFHTTPAPARGSRVDRTIF